MVLKTAVVGGGTVSGSHLPALEENPLTDLVAICDIEEERASEAAGQYGIKAYLDIDELLRQEDLDWIHICTPVQTHRDLALRAIEAGIPTLIEKPVTLASEEIKEITQAASDNDVRVSAVRNHLFTQAMVETRDRLESGELGDLRGVDVIYTGNTRPDEPNRGAWTFDLPGGEFEEGIPHPIYLGLETGGYPRDEAAVNAITSLHGTYDHDFEYDGLHLQWVTDDETLVSVKTMAGGIPQRFVFIHGEKLSLLVDQVSQTAVRLQRDYIASPKARGLNNVDHVLGRVQGTIDNAVGMAKRQWRSDWETKKHWDAHTYQYDVEARALLTDDDPPLPFQGAYWSVRLMELVRAEAKDSRERDNDVDKTPSKIGVDLDG